ncbi:MAG: phosphodiester glycosidase family protein, partial [Phascolarctobacterium sp.]|nr:phosphodiester glycosidase family protein [Phascolarctobacterium sp.]
LNIKPFVAKQIWNWIYCKGITDFKLMSNISKQNIEILSNNFSIFRPKVITTLKSSDGTMKWLLEMKDSEKIELVFIPALEDDRGTLCISSQVGCSMGCKFCNTGSQGLTRNLEVFEIVSEVLIARDLLDDWKNINKAIDGREITNIVAGKERLIVQDVAYNGVLRFKGGELPIKGMNRGRIAEDVVLFNEYYGPSTKTNQWGREIKIRDNKVIAVSNKGNMKIEPDTFVVSAHGLANKYLLRSIAVGDEVELVQKLNVPIADKAPIVMGGGPLILENGKVHVRTSEEYIPRDIAVGSAPRTAIGLKKDGTVLVLVVDGRSNTSRGLTLKELATYFLRLGARDAVNFDGGGSSVMVINGEVVNKPSDGRERPVSMALGLFPKF